MSAVARTKRVPWRSGLGGALALFWAIPGWAQGPTGGTPQQVSAVDAARLYAGACAPCHGRYGDGKGRAAQWLGSPQPRDFTSGVFKFHSTPTGSVIRDEDLYRTISRGVPGTWMPGWEALLTPAERWALVRYIKGFSPLSDQGEPAPPVEIPSPPVPSPELVREGRFVYAMLQCAKCHGAGGRGDGPSAADLKDDWGERNKPYDLTRGAYRNGAAPSDLYRTLLTGLSGTPMPALEPAGAAFPGGRDAEVARFKEQLSPAELRELETYLATQPLAAELARLAPDEVDRLIQRRLWAVVYYVRSLIRPRTLFYRLFQENPELTTGRREP